MQDAIANLQSKIAARWVRAHKESRLLQLIFAGGYDARLYAVYMAETYHYTRHNSRNQALVATRRELLDPRYLKYCLKHAEEETGHELMALHDMRSVFPQASEANLPAYLNETEVLIAYLYQISAYGNPLRRLGYSLWAESVYGHIAPVLKKLATDLSLKPSQMSFFVAHSDIDADHAAELERIIAMHAKSPEDFAAIEDVALTSLELTIRMLDAVADEYQALRADGNSRYRALLTG